MPLLSANQYQIDEELAKYTDLLAAIILAAAKERFLSATPDYIRPEEATDWAKREALQWWKEVAPCPDNEWDAFQRSCNTEDGPENKGYRKKPIQPKHL